MNSEAPDPDRGAVLGRGGTAEGYLEPGYAEAFRPFGRPVRLARSGGWLLERRIPGTDRHDAMGLRPYFFCRDWAGLREDIAEQGRDWVALVLVTDPFGAGDTATLEACFDEVAEFKEAFVADLAVPLEGFVSRSHRANARRALNKVEVEVCSRPSAYLDDWLRLFGNLVLRHRISGIDAYSPESFRHQLHVPGMIAFRAVQEGRTVGLDLWCMHGDVAHAHLVAMDDVGYACGASYATKWTAMTYFAQRLRWMNFGALPGQEQDTSRGLGHFKAGWSNARRRSYLCKLILDEPAYAALSEADGDASFFPAYRSRMQ